MKRRDEKQIIKIIRQKHIVKHMRDWSDNSLIPGRLTGYIGWLQSQKHSTDVYENKRYAIVNPDDDVLIGMVGMGLEDTLNEVEMAYFIDEGYQLHISF